MRQFTSTDTYHVTGRGLVRGMHDPDPVLELGERVEIDGIVGTIIGLERHRPAGPPRPGWPVGVLLKEGEDV